MMKRLFSVAAILAVVLLTLTGCSSGNDEETANAVGVVVASTYVDSEAASALQEKLQAALPVLNTDTMKLTVTAISTGDTEKDPMGTMAGLTQISGMLTSSEIDVIICDADNARRHGDDGETFLPLDDIFTEAEQDELGIIPVSVPVIGDEGDATGEVSAPCGVDLSGCVELTQTLKLSDIAAYVVVNTENPEEAESVVRQLLAMK